MNHVTNGIGHLDTRFDALTRQPITDAQSRANVKELTNMKTFGFASIVASGLAAAVLGLAAPAQGDLGHNTWVNQMSASVPTPQVDTSVHQSR